MVVSVDGVLPLTTLRGSGSQGAPQEHEDSEEEGMQ
jgi:hypothetical protein